MADLPEPREPNSNQGASPNDVVLAEMVRQSERVLDHQVHAIEELDDKSEHMLTLGVAVLGGGAALATVASQSLRGFIDATFMWTLATAGVINLLALVLFLGSYIGFRAHTEIHVGPSLAWIEEKSNDASWAILDLQLSFIKDMPTYYEWNNVREVVSARRRRWGTYALLAAVTGYGSAFIYLLSQAIGGA